MAAQKAVRIERAGYIYRVCRRIMEDGRLYLRVPPRQVVQALVEAA